MAQLVPAPFADLVAQVYAESRVQDSVFSLPRRKWHITPTSGINLSTRFHGHRIGNPSGPAAGPHTQMAQNILLSYLAGGRVMELKTVQVRDQLLIPRPCIDMTNVGYNIEWSQELSIEQSLREYVAASMLIQIIRSDPQLGCSRLKGADGDVLFDMSIGYNLAGIRSATVQRFLDGMRDAGPLVKRLRDEIGPCHATARAVEFPSCISTSVTLSTFHGCPADEIERICEFLLAERGLHVIVKMNPPMLGRDRLEHLLHDELGYTELTVNPAVYEAGLVFKEAVELTDRLTGVAQSRGLSFGCKFTNTLEVLNHRGFFAPENRVQYLSGQPLYVLAMALTDVFRREVGPAVPISFSAGIDRHNFADAVACGLVPVSVCTDLLRPGGYGRLPAYLEALVKRMQSVGAGDLESFALDALGQRQRAERLHSERGGSPAQWAALLNTSIVAERARADDRYRAAANRGVQRRIESTLSTFDCITCDRCIPVCPNAANFSYPTPRVEIDYRDLVVDPSGKYSYEEPRRFELGKSWQIGNFADFCNDCGNCDTFCPEHGGPYRMKPAFHGSEESWLAAAPRDGYFVKRCGAGWSIHGRVGGRCYALVRTDGDGTSEFRDGDVSLVVSDSHCEIIECRLLAPLQAQHRVDMQRCLTMRYLLDGILDSRRVNPVGTGARRS